MPFVADGCHIAVEDGFALPVANETDDHVVLGQSPSFTVALVFGDQHAEVRYEIAVAAPLGTSDVIILRTRWAAETRS